jgi:type IV pilus assembly protein PilY1
METPKSSRVHLLRSLAMGGLLVLMFEGHSVAQASAACCFAGTSRATAALNPPQGEDTRFFTAGGSSFPNLAIGIMRPRRMLELPYTIREIRTVGGGVASNNGLPVKVGLLDAVNAPTGCQNSMLNSMTYFQPAPRNEAGVSTPSLAGTYVNTKVYPRPEIAYASTLAQSGAAGTPTKLFESDKYYGFLDWGNDCGNQDRRCLPQTSAAAACTRAGAGLLASAGCQQCLATRGYWLNPETDSSITDNRAGAFAGNWLNFQPPKFLVMRLALKTVLKEAAAGTMRIAIFTADRSTVGSGAENIEPLDPPCSNLAGPNRDGVGNTLTGLAYQDDDKNPIAEVMTNIGQYFSEYGRWETIFGTKKTTRDIDFNRDGNAGRPHCTSCTKTFILLFSDGRGDEGNPRCVADGSGNAVAPCSRVNRCTEEGMGMEDDGNIWISDLVPGYGRAVATGDGIRKTPANTCDRDYADDIARFLYETDMYRNGDLIDAVRDDARQFSVTYTIGVGSNFNSRQRVLAEVAKAGGGKYMNATSYRAMVDALRLVFTEVNRQATSFSTSSASQLQTSSGSSAFVPRFKPDRDRLWNGFLYRWGVFNEFVEDRDLNADGDKEDVLLVQKVVPPATAQRTDIVTEDEQGNFILPNNGNRKATPWWEAGERLNNLAATRALDARRIYTALDDSAPYGRIDSRDSVIEFTENNVSRLLPYLGLEGTNVCSILAESLVDPTVTTDLTLCARMLIRYTRGHDTLDVDGNGDRNEARENLLGDIFHSNPKLLDVPSDKFLCDLGLDPQCARTIYATSTSSGAATPLARYTVNGTEIDAYTKYREQYKGRDRLVLVGANDGMLHAFHAGSVISPAPPITRDNVLPDSHDKGTGDEVWAFIPPDLLNKLQLRISEDAHHFFVDGDVLIRDVWVDKTTGTVGTKEWDEFRTMVVISERRGGNHYVALDVTEPMSGQTWPKPAFRWIFPQPCSDEGYEVGETFMSVAPKPPPIGPVLLKTTDTRFPVRQGVNTEERWVVFLQGGYDTNYSRGQGLYVLDMGSGNMLWKAYFDRSQTPSAANPTGSPVNKYLRYPISAPIGAVDFGRGDGRLDQDGYFDTALVGDSGGQLWVLRMFAPGERTIDPSASSSNESSAKLVSNWYLARAFQQDGTEVTDVSTEPGVGTLQSTTNLATINPIHSIVEAAYQTETGALRAYFGTGDRYNLRDPRAGTCRVDNPMACAKYGCEWKSDLTLDYGGKRVLSHMHFLGGSFKHLTRSTTASAQTDACTYRSARQVDVLTSCPGSWNPGTIKDIERQCSGSPFTCTNPTNTLGVGDYQNTSFSDTGLNRNRFYGLWAYGGARSFRVGVSTTESVAGANAFDGNRVRDTAAAPNGLTDVTAATATTGGASSSGNGWYVNMGTLPERTASGAAIVASCSLWNSIEAASATMSACNTGQTFATRLYQANVWTGQPNCAVSLNGARSVSRQLRSPPPEPAVTVAISSTGQIKYQPQSFEPGGTQAMTQEVSSSTDVLQLVYSLELTQQMHTCRHDNADAGCP